MNEYLEFLIARKVYVSLLMEILAALAGSLYLLKIQKPDKLQKQFVWFLWSVFIIDLLGGYSIWAYFDNYETFPFLKDSLFTRSFWWYNLAKVYRIAVFCYFLYKMINNVRIALLLKWAALIFMLFAVYNMIFSGEFFTSYIVSTIIAGTFLMISGIFAFFYDILISDRLFGFYRSLFIYAFIGVLIWYLVIPPIEIYVNYFTKENELFIEVFAAVLRYANILMYGMFILGFYMDYRFNRRTERPLQVKQ